MLHTLHTLLTPTWFHEGQHLVTFSLIFSRLGKRKIWEKMLVLIFTYFPRTFFPLTFLPKYTMKTHLHSFSLFFSFTFFEAKLGLRSIKCVLVWNWLAWSLMRRFKFWLLVILVTLVFTRVWKQFSLNKLYEILGLVNKMKMRLLSFQIKTFMGGESQGVILVWGPNLSFLLSL